MNFRRSEPTSMDRLINKSLGRNPMFTVLQNWHSIVGDILFAVAAPVKFKNSTLIVGVTTHSWIQELMLNRHLIMKRIREFTDGVKDIKFLIKTEITDLKKNSAPVKTIEEKQMETVLLSDEVMQFITDIASAIRDEDLRLVVHNAMCDAFARRQIRTT